MSDRLKKVTIRDVANAAKVAPSTVSRAFSKPDRVSAVTAKRIFVIADDLGYHRDVVENRPIRRRKGLVAILVPDIANQFFSDIIRSVQRELFAKDFALIVLESQENASLERLAFNKIVDSVDGIILVSSRMPDSMVRKCAQARPLVVVNRVVRGVPSVIVDVQQGVRLAINQLQIRGSKDIIYIDGPANSWSVGVRWKSIRDECKKRNISVHRFWPGVPTFEGGNAAVDKFLRAPTDAVIAHNDMMAVGFVAGLRKRGIECPRDYLIVGFDDDAVGRMSDPSISSIHMPLSELGVRAALLLSVMIEGERKPQLLSCISSTLIPRESTGDCIRTYTKAKQGLATGAAIKD